MTFRNLIPAIGNLSILAVVAGCTVALPGNLSNVPKTSTETDAKAPALVPSGPASTPAPAAAKQPEPQQELQSFDLNARPVTYYVDATETSFEPSSLSIPYGGRVRLVMVNRDRSSDHHIHVVGMPIAGAMWLGAGSHAGHGAGGGDHSEHAGHYRVSHAGHHEEFAEEEPTPSPSPSPEAVAQDDHGHDHGPELEWVKHRENHHPCVLGDCKAHVEVFMGAGPVSTDEMVFTPTRRGTFEAGDPFDPKRRMTFRVF